ncbi:MerR family transcriptional regulator [Microlunatus soli]|uniref:MerR family transcriptional regulator n=1 Tax=Microlunatus soli TaxID=630515 RepID=UPI0015605E50|nr:MerR family transcriptional regulator [Microlunatus soli]
MAPEDPTATLRPIDLARGADISPSSVRMYEAEGFIPPAVRTATGHRRYTPSQLRRLLVARTLRTGYGWSDARVVMRAVNAGDIDGALAVTNRRHADLHREAERLGRAIDAIDDAQLEQRSTGDTIRPLSIGAAAARLGVTPATLRHWESVGVIDPPRAANGRRHYRPTDLGQLELVQVLRSADYSFAAIAELLAGLKTDDPAQARRALATRQSQLRHQSREAARATHELYGLIAELQS